MPKVTPEVLDWNKQWYPVHAVRDLDPTKPHPVTLLGLPRTHTCLACTLLQSALLAQAFCTLVCGTNASLTGYAFALCHSLCAAVLCSHLCSEPAEVQISLCCSACMHGCAVSKTVLLGGIQHTQSGIQAHISNTRDLQCHAGKDIVLWSSKGEWKAFVDLCPHRFVNQKLQQLLCTAVLQAHMVICFNFTRASTSRNICSIVCHVFLHWS